VEEKKDEDAGIEEEKICSEQLVKMWRNHYDLVTTTKKLVKSIVTQGMIKDEINKTFNN
jgi:hypothetical protein